MSLVTIAFVGQCHTVGYAGVPPDAAFPEVCRRAIERARPGTRIRIVLHPYYHPAELATAVKRAVRGQPFIVVLEVVGWLAVSGSRAVDLSRLPVGVRSAYDRVRHFRHVAQKIVKDVPRGAELVYHTQTTVKSFASGVLRPLLQRYPRPTVAEYAQELDAALRAVRAAPGPHVVIQGPGAPNLTLEGPGLPPDVLDRYLATREMARRAADAYSAMYIDRWDTVAPGFFSDNSVRPTARAHEVWGNLLSAELLAHGIL